MVAFFKYLSWIALASLFLVSCSESSGRLPQRRLEPAVNERRVSLELGGLQLRDNRQHNVIVFLHKSDNATVNSLTEYPKDQYIIMQPGDREDIHEAFVSMPESYADMTRIIITVVSVPDGTTERAINSIGTIILGEITNKIPGKRIVQWIATLAAGEISDRLQAVIASGEVLEICEITLNINGPPTQTCGNNQQAFAISTRQVISAPESVLISSILNPEGASPIEVLTPESPQQPVENTPVEHTVVSVVRRFNADQTIAMRELDLNRLRATSAGQWFDWQATYMDTLRQQNLYEVQQQQKFDVLSVSVVGDTATVVTQETWRTAKYDRTTNSCRFHQPSFTTTQTYTLVRKADGWKIIYDDFEPEAPEDIPGC
jgi:hypothetical protein